ncbi:MAG: hypothetical protein JW774_01745 [Candidatus Aureabacteria bacterium]|nr:hypothetical protein [Candidatus Auribacterota bacterium]
MNNAIFVMKRTNKRALTRFIGNCFILLSSLPTLLAGESFQFDGEIVERKENKVVCRLDQIKNAEKELAACVYSPNRVVTLPGTEVAIVNEWLKVGEIRVVPFSGSSSFEIASEITPLAIKRGCKIQWVSNRPPKFLSLKLSNTSVPKGTKIWAQVTATDAENDSFTIEWKSDKGHWMKSKTRSGFNYYIAPEENGTVKLTLTAVDAFGGRASHDAIVTVQNKSSKDLYEFKNTYFKNHLRSSAQDCLVDPEGTILVLEKNNVKIFSSRGVLKKLLKGYFENGLKVKFDKDSGYVFVLDKEQKTVFKFTLDGKLLCQTQKLSQSEDGVEIVNPSDLEIGSNGTIYILDDVFCRIFLFNANGYLTGSIGHKGQTENQWIHPIAMELSQDGTLYVLDEGDLKIKAYDSRFQLKDSFSLSERFTYRDLTLDDISRKIILSGNLKTLSRSEAVGYLTVLDIRDKAAVKIAPVQGTEENPLRTISLDPDGELIVTTEKPGPVLLIDSKGRLKAQFLQEDPYYSTVIAAGRLGNIYFQSKNSMIKRLNCFGWVDQSFKNDGNLLAMAVDTQAENEEENVYLVNKGTNKIRVYDFQGRPIRDIAFPLNSKEKIIGIGVDGWKQTYLLKTPATLTIFSKLGSEIKTEDLSPKIPPIKNNEWLNCESFYVDVKGLVYLLDKSRKAVFIYSPSSKEMKIIQGSFSKAKHLSVDLFGNIYILDPSSRVVFKYDPSGNLKREISIKKEIGSRSGALAAFGDGELLIFDQSTKALYLYR